MVRKISNLINLSNVLLLGFNLGLGSDLSLKENNYNSAEIFIAENFSNYLIR